MIQFPASPTLGQQYVGINTVTYTWLGNRWSSVNAIEDGTAEFYVDGGDGGFEYDPLVNEILDGGYGAPT